MCAGNYCPNKLFGRNEPEATHFELRNQNWEISLIAQMMTKTDQEMMIEEYGLLPFNVRVLEPSRTICEKIMSLVRFSYTEDPISDLKKKIRHAYDLHQLLSDKKLLEFVELVQLMRLPIHLLFWMAPLLMVILTPLVEIKLKV